MPAWAVSIAKKLAEELGIEFYDRDIVEQTARRMGLPVSTISDTEESANNIYYKRIYPLGMAIKSMQDEVFMVQQNIIRDLADRESCIIVGRCADEVLKDHPLPFERPRLCPQGRPDCATALRSWAWTRQPPKRPFPAWTSPAPATTRSTAAATSTSTAT